MTEHDHHHHEHHHHDHGVPAGFDPFEDDTDRDADDLDPADAADDDRGRRRGPRGHRHGRRGGFGPGPGDFGPPDFGPGGFGPGGFGPRGFGPRGFGAGFAAGFGPMEPPGPGRRGPAGRRRRKGAVRLAILSLLAEQPRNGYGLIQAIAERTESTWTPSPGSVYPTLQQLVDEGLIEATSDDRSSDYRLTEQGSAYVAEHAEELDSAWRSAEDESRGSNELRTSIAQLMGVVHQFRFASTDQRTRAVAALDETRRTLYSILAE